MRLMWFSNDHSWGDGERWPFWSIMPHSRSHIAIFVATPPRGQSDNSLVQDLRQGMWFWEADFNTYWLNCAPTNRNFNNFGSDEFLYIKTNTRYQYMAFLILSCAVFPSLSEAYTIEVQLLKLLE